MRSKAKIEETPSPLNANSHQEKPLSPSRRAWYEKRKHNAEKSNKSQIYQLADEALQQDNALKKKGLHLKPLTPKPQESDEISIVGTSVPLLKDELERFFNIGEFEKAVRDTSDIEVLRLADELAKELREIVQNRIKHTLWGDAPPEGTVSFKPFVQDDTRVYLKASVRGSSRLVGTVEGEEREAAIKEHQQRKFQDAIESERKTKKTNHK